MRRGLLFIACAGAFTASACSASSGTSSPPQTLDTPPPSSLVLHAGGIGAFAVGDEPDAIIEGISSTVGGPDRDSQWIDPDAAYGTCPGEMMRAVGWGSLFLVFVEHDGDRTLFTWTYGFDYETGARGDPRRLALTTTSGIGLGSSRSDLIAAHGTDVTFEVDTDLQIFAFRIGDGGEAAHLRGVLAGPDDADTITFIERLPGCP